MLVINFAGDQIDAEGHSPFWCARLSTVALLFIDWRREST
jgi:hypothetical protein